MAIKKIYTNNNQDLEIKWSKRGIHLIITTEDIETPTEYIIAPEDMFSVIQDLTSLREYVKQSILDESK